MQYVRFHVVAVAIAIAFMTLPGVTLAQQDPESVERLSVPIYLFWEPGCPHCRRARDFIEPRYEDDESVNIIAVNVSDSTESLEFFIAANVLFDIQVPAVPLIVVGDRIFMGFGGPETTGAELVNAIQYCRSEICSDPLSEFMIRQFTRSEESGSGSSTQQEELGTPSILPPYLELPFFGTIRTQNLSLPVLTVVMAAVDGFNPCAMWVLVFLVGLLLGMDDHSRMWILGGTFLLTSAAVYFAVLAAWLNVLVLLASIIWVRFAIGLFALGAGGYYLREFVLAEPDVCKVTSPGQRAHIMDRLREAVGRRSLTLAVLGIVVLAAAVNLIELLCSAGIPAVYTQVLTMAGLPLGQNYAYLALYIVVFLLDDLAVFVVAMVTLQLTRMTGRFTRYSHLIGGAVLCLVGALLILRPELLTMG